MRLSAASSIFLGYIVISFVGALLLMLPLSHKGELTFMEALFTSTSAVCVTGLIVVDTALKYTTIGKIIIATLIQIGGLGYMTLTALLFSIIGIKGSLYARKLMITSIGAGDFGDVIRFATSIFIVSTIMESLASVFLFLSFLSKYNPLEALGHAVFHSISAFNNAGFSTFSENLINFSHDPLVNTVVLLLIVIGGIGFKVWSDIYEHVKNNKRVSLHAKIVASSTLALIVIPFLFFFFVEKSTMGDFWKSIFASITPRTAGFNTVDYSTLSPLSLIITMTLMFIGGSPGGTAGGIKTVTFAVVLLWVINTLRGNKDVMIFKRSIPSEAVVKALQTFVLATVIFWLWTLVLSFTESNVIKEVGFLKFLFEIFSAFGTVGLSTGGITKPNVSLVTDFSTTGKVMMIFAMIIGRAGYLIFAASLIQPRRLRFRYAEGEVVL